MTIRPTPTNFIGRRVAATSLRLVGLSLALGVLSCDGKSTHPAAGPSTALKQAALSTYAAHLFQAYSDSVTDAQALKIQAAAFLADPAPTEQNLTTTRNAWVASRAHYMLVEGARFYNGPIDGPSTGNPEALLNSWPLDEANIDYVSDGLTVNETSGIINDPVGFPVINAQLIANKNGQDGDDNIYAGWHAIEFLLWGQALAPVGPGQRAASDFQLTGGTHFNADRRRTYLTVALDLLVEDLVTVCDAWAPNQSNYRATFLAQTPTAALAQVFSGLGKMSKGELAGQRIDAAYISKDRRDQHDCFSSQTLVDYLRDAQGLADLYHGVYEGDQGVGFDQLVRVANPTLADQIDAQLMVSVQAVAAIPAPFESAILGSDGSPGRAAIQTAVVALRRQGDLFAQAAAALGADIVVPEINP